MVKREMAAWSAGTAWRSRTGDACSAHRQGLQWRVLLVAFAAWLVLAVPACSSKSKVAFDSGIPTIRSSMQVVKVRELGPYLQAHLTLDRWELEAYSLPSDVCRAVFVPGETVQYVASSPLPSRTP